MKDYDGDMDFYQKQLEKKGITKDMFDIQYCDEALEISRRN